MNKLFLSATVLLFTFMLLPIKVSAATPYDSRFTSFSSTGEAWTTCGGDQNIAFFYESDSFNTGLVSSVPQAGTGEHRYNYDRKGLVPVKRWEVGCSVGRCIHRIIIPDNMWAGVYCANTQCYRNYFSGWFAYCADCDALINTTFIYMSKECAQDLNYILCGTNYYYSCPFCSNLEMGVYLAHNCVGLSKNRYVVKYDKNASDAYGSMGTSTHVYDGGNVYEGAEIACTNNLIKNQYRRQGYSFAGWALSPFGRVVYKDGENVLNMTTENYNAATGRGVVTLYAVWEPLAPLSIAASIENNDGGGNIFLPGETGTLTVFVTGKPNSVDIIYPVNVNANGNGYISFTPPSDNYTFRVQTSFSDQIATTGAKSIFVRAKRGAEETQTNVLCSVIVPGDKLPGSVRVRLR